MSGLGDRAELREQLILELRQREEGLAHLLRARAAGQIEAGLTLRSLALSLHSLKGTLALLGLSAPAAHLAEISKTLRSAEDAPDLFWNDCTQWMRSFFAQCQRSVDEDVNWSELTLLKRRLCDDLGKTQAVTHGSTGPSELTLDHMSASAGRRVMLIDDSALVRTVVTARLGDRGYPIRSATNLAEALAICRTFAPEIVICDIQIPGETGDEMCEHLKSQLPQPVSVILYSSLSHGELAERAVRCGADGYACKLGAFEALLAAMDHAMQRTTR